MRRIELLSEGLSTKTSPITVALLTFPQITAEQQAFTFSSFMFLFPPQSLGEKVPHKVDAGDFNCEQSKANGQQLRLPLKNNLCRFFLKILGILTQLPSADGYSRLQNPRRNHCIPKMQYNYFKLKIIIL